MSAQQRFTSEEIVTAYKATGSIWKAAKMLGACGQSVWERLRRMGYTLVTERWSDEEIAELEALAPQCTLGEVGRRLGRSYASVACKISELGIGVRYGNCITARTKRGSGLTKASVAQFVKQLSRFDGKVTQFARQRGLDIESLVQAIQRYEPEFWASYVSAHSDLQPKRCPQCFRGFVPFAKKQDTCSRRCSTLRRTDKQYFSGKRSLAVGMAEGICQLCGKERKGLSAHHLFGKENDCENDYLIALCRGCHQLVGTLGCRADALDPAFWENLIGLAVTRKKGNHKPKPLGYHVCVEIEDLEEEDLENMSEQGRFGESQGVELATANTTAVLTPETLSSAEVA